METATESMRDSEDLNIARLLQCHFGDGDIYLRDGASQGILRAAVCKGYLTEDGYITRKGRALLAKYRS